MRLIKKQSKKVYKGQDGKERHYYNFYLETDNGKRVAVKPIKNEDSRLLDMVAVYER